MSSADCPTGRVNKWMWITFVNLRSLAYPCFSVVLFNEIGKSRRICKRADPLWVQKDISMGWIFWETTNMCWLGRDPRVWSSSVIHTAPEAKVGTKNLLYTKQTSKNYCYHPTTTIETLCVPLGTCAFGYVIGCKYEEIEDGKWTMLSMMWCQGPELFSILLQNLSSEVYCHWVIPIGVPQDALVRSEYYPGQEEMAKMVIYRALAPGLLNDFWARDNKPQTSSFLSTDAGSG